MFTLREYFENGIEKNTTLGRSYTLYTQENCKDIKDHIKERFGVDFVNVLYGFIDHEGGESIPLYHGNNFYIMTEGGKTYSVIRT